MQPEKKCMRCTKANRVYKDENSKWVVDCEVLGTRKARANKVYCRAFTEIYDFTLINMEKPFSEWKWVKKVYPTHG